ncbi:MAG: vancomycin high temperature exclusion protein [Spirochaetia bacterium]
MVIFLLFCITILLASLPIIIMILPKNNLFQNLRDLPKYRNGIVMGAPKFLRNCDPNQFFNARIKLAAELYRNNSVYQFIVSGFHTNRGNEVLDMLQSLKQLGIPEDRIFLDPKGKNTYQTLQNYKECFQEPCVIISQAFHLKRTFILARALNIQCAGVCADTVPFCKSWKTYVREYCALWKSFFYYIKALRKE